MSSGLIPIARPDIGPMERENVQKVMESGWLSQGPFVEQAEEKLRRMTGRKYVICTSSGTASLLAALLACDIDSSGWGEVPVPAMTFAAVHNVVSIFGFLNDFLPSDSETWQVDPKEWDSVSTRSAVIVANCYGKVSGTVLAGSDTIVINDIAESFGGTHNGFPAGAFGTIACCSFYANKICTAGEGGAILTDREDLYRKLHAIVNHGMIDKTYRPAYIGLNARMTDMQAAVLCAQLDRMDEMVRIRRKIMLQYMAAAAGRPWTFPARDPAERLAPWLFAGVHTDIQSIQDRARKANIEWRLFFPIPDAAGKSTKMAKTRFISENGICLPLSSTLTDSEISRVCEVISGN